MSDPSWKFEREAVSPLFEMGLDGFPDLASCLSADRGPDQLSGWLPDGDPSAGGAVRGRLPPVGGVQAPPPKEWSPGKINKNAIAARLNRQKKKEYVSGLESRVNSLATENKDLKEENSHLNKRVEELEDETRYLRAVLANESVLAQLLSRLTGVNGMKLSTSLFQESRKDEHDYALPRKRVKVEERETSGGVCLHVDKNHVSVEFCTKCAESASASFKIFLLGDCCAMLGWWVTEQPCLHDSMWILLWGKLKKRDQLLASCPGFCLKVV
ncbi:CREB/ATF bZIP transcription factor [Lepisosteus oculatus]|uniref:CREB/ATF bZIP transcription factor n=1 Tax=Lepisosteus oculatus TaxID=7918 RepID=UPI003724B6E9